MADPCRRRVLRGLASRCARVLRRHRHQQRHALPIDTWITLEDDGRLSGRYVLHEPARDMPGTLEMVADDGCNTTLFRWTDLYGTGVERLQFFPAEHCFEGTWGQLVLNPQFTIGTCSRSKVTS